MMKRVLCLLLIAITLCTTLSIPALAANLPGQETVVTYTVDTEYTVYIPESIDLSTSTIIEITADCRIEPNNHLYVRIDKDMSLVDGMFWLYKDGDKSASKMNGQISISAYGTFEYFTLEETEYTVAVFENANAAPIEYGCIYISPGIAGTQEFGTYYGSLYFTFSVE